MYYQLIKEKLGKEEPFDFLIYRPIANLIVKSTLSLPLHANHFSMLALLVGLISGILIFLSQPNSWFTAGIGILIFNVLDCCDGMYARAKGNASKYGHWIDRIVDIISNTSLLTALWICLDSPLYKNLVLASTVAIAMHALAFQYFKNQYVNSKSNLIDWSFTAGSTHLTILSIALLINKIELYFSYALIFANILFIRAAIKRIKQTALS